MSVNFNGKSILQNYQYGNYVKLMCGYSLHFKPEQRERVYAYNSVTSCLCSFCS
jgi:hypothetical protein